jgi:tetratricopeptide (TPR) repeat protein
MRIYILILCGCLLVANIVNAQSADRNKVMEYLQEQRYDEAIAYLKPAIDTNNAKEVALLAYTYYQGGKTTDAAGYYEKALSLDSNNVTAHQYLATILIQQEQPLGAISHFKRITAIQPLNPAAWKQLSFAAFSGHLNDSAFNWLCKAYELKPSDARVVSRLAEEWLDRKQYNRADSLISLYLSTDSGSAIILMTGTRTSFLKKDYPRTLIFGQKLMAQNIVAANPFLYVVSACYNMKKYRECVSVYEYLSARNATSETIIYYAAMAKTQLGAYEESNELLKICIAMAMSKSLDNYYSGMAINLEALGKYKPAIANLDTAYYLFHQPLRQYSIGRIYDAHLKNEAVALRYYRKYLQLYKPEATEEEAQIYKYLKSRVETK